MKKLEHISYQDKSVKRVFTPPPMVFCHSARRLSMYLVRPKLNRLERKRGSYKCGNLRCQICSNFDEIEIYKSQEPFLVNHLS